MKDPIKNVELSFSCPERWENLQDVGNGKYCCSCKHMVVDFTKLRQAEFDDAVKNAPGRLCGRFKSSQMNSRFLKYASAAALVASMIAPTACMPDDSLAAIEPSAPSVPEELVEEAEYYTVGIAFIPDNLYSASDTTMSDEPPPGEDAYFEGE